MGVWLGGGEETNVVNSGVFFLNLPKCFLPKMGRKRRGEFDSLN